MSNLREPHVGVITQFLGMGMQRYCLLCKTHRPNRGGTVKALAGGRHWVCSEHKNA